MWRNLALAALVSAANAAEPNLEKIDYDNSLNDIAVKVFADLSSKGGL